MVRVVIDTERMRTLANQIEGWVGQMVDLLNSIKTMAGKLVSTFGMVGQAINSFLSKINIEVNIVINRCCPEIRAYATFLNTAAAEFDAAEAAGVAKTENMASVF